MQKKYIGEVRHVICQMASPTEDLFSGLGLKGTEADLFQPMASTWSDPSKAGGYGWGQLSHLLGLLFLLIPYPPKKVYAVMNNSPAGVDLYDAAVITLWNGATVSLSGSSTVPKSRSFQIDIRIFGTEGMLLLDIERERLEVVRNDGKTYLYAISPGGGAYTCEEPVTRFVEICRGQAVFNPADGIIGMCAVQVLDAMYRSAQSGRIEEI
jgi:predicted dehydrogenase